MTMTHNPDDANVRHHALFLCNRIGKKCLSMLLLQNKQEPDLVD